MSGGASCSSPRLRQVEGAAGPTTADARPLQVQDERVQQAPRCRSLSTGHNREQPQPKCGGEHLTRAQLGCPARARAAASGVAPFPPADEGLSVAGGGTGQGARGECRAGHRTRLQRTFLVAARSRTRSRARIPGHPSCAVELHVERRPAEASAYCQVVARLVRERGSSSLPLPTPLRILG